MSLRFRKKIIALFSACLLVLACVLSMPGHISEAAPRDVFLAGFRQTVYNQENGLASAEVNCIYQTQSGYIWIGTDGGLYRFNGKEFKIFNLWNTDKDDVYFINNLFQDSTGRLWVSTDNYGLFYIKGSEVNHFTSDYYDGVKCINDVCEGVDGTIYVAANTGLYRVSEDGPALVPVEGMNDQTVKDITIAGKNLWGIGNGDSIFTISDMGNLIDIRSTDYTQEELSCILGMEDGTVYIGTMGTEVLHINRAFHCKSYNSVKDGINFLYQDGERIFACADSGMGYFDRNMGFHSLNDVAINRYVTSMIVDYEGDYWFSSSRQGVLLLGRSKFRNFNEQYGIAAISTNCMLEDDELAYIGTDEGLIVVDQDMNVVENEIAAYLDGVSIRHVMKDSQKNLWISTSRRYGVLKCSPDGTITNFGRGNALPTNQVNCTLELADKSVAVATEEGIAFIDTEGKVTRTVTPENGLNYPNIICLYQSEDGRVFAGSDGGGLYVLEGEKLRSYTVDDGLTSNVVTSLVKGNSGLWIGTDNGLSIFTEGIRAVSNIDFSNNIYDIVPEEPTEEDESIRLWIIGSKGVISATEEELLGTNPLSERYLAQGDGLDLQISLNSRSMLRERMLYICCNSGIQMLNTAAIPKNTIAPKLTVSEINVDDTVFHLDQLGGTLAIPAETQRLSISFAVLSFTNRENVVVEYKLEGFDSAPISITPSDPMQAVYTNLEGGTYTFTVSAYNGDGVRSAQDITFTINKTFGFFEKQSTKIMIGVMIALILLLVLVGMIRLRNRMLGQGREIEKLEKEHEVAVKSSSAKTDFLAHMSNEIKIPVNAIISLAETMQRESDENARQEGLRAIASSGQEILGKVDETIQLARLESGRVTVVNAPYSITTLVCDISDRMINVLGDKPVRFLVDLGENIPDIMMGDYDKIKHVLEILLDNAEKYTREGTITLFVDSYAYPEQKDKLRLIFNISDTGIGIQKERLQHIFEVYNIADNKRQTGYSGSGISLAIAKQLTEIMNGEIEVESTYGAGSTFTVTLMQDMPGQDAVPVTSGSEAEPRITREEAERMVAPEAAVLLVDDVEISRTVAVGVLRQMDIDADVADSGMAAIDLVMNRDYDLILMDLAMPVMNGTDAMKEIRELAREGAEEIPIIAMTEDAINEEQDALKDSGFSAVIVKPINLVELAGMLQMYLPDKVGVRTREIETYTTETRYQEALQLLGQHLDVTGVLEKIGGSVEVYNRILSTFYNQNLNAPEELKVKFTEDYRSFRNRIHNIRSGAQNIGAIELQNHIMRIDSAINIGNKGYVRDNLPALFQMMEEVLSAIAEYQQFLTQAGEGMQVAEGGMQIAGMAGDSAAVAEGVPIEAAGTAGETKTSDRKAAGKEPGSGGEDAKKPKPAKGKRYKPIHREQIDFAVLDTMLEAVNNGDQQALKDGLKKISRDTYGSEDTEFLQVLTEKVEEEDLAAVAELIGTYKELKK